MTRTKQPFRDFDMTVKHLTEGEHWKPPVPRNEAEAARLAALREGGPIADYQYRGIHIAARILEYVADSEPDQFLIETLSAIEYNTAWYNYARNVPNRMRRRLKLPRHDENPDGLEAGKMLTLGLRDLASTDRSAKFLTHLPGTPNHTKNLGITLGETALHIASIGVLPELKAAGRDTFLVEEITRYACLQMVELSRGLHKEVHANPALAQLADPNSPLSHYWRVQGSNLAIDALEYATELPIAA